MNRLLLICLFLLAPLVGAAETSFPFKYKEGLLWIQVQIPQSTRPLQFLLDSGAQVSVINLATARGLRLPLGVAREATGVGGVSRGFWPVHAKVTADGNLLTRKCLGLDLAFLSDACGQKVDGLIGADFFRDKVTEIDFDRELITVSKTAPLVSSDTICLSLENSKRGFCLQANVEGLSGERFRLDTGSALTHLVSQSSMLLSKSIPRVSIGLAPRQLAASPVTWHLGMARLTNVDTVLHQKTIFEGEKGLIGNNILSQFKVVVDAPGRMLLLSWRGEKSVGKN